MKKYIHPFTSEFYINDECKVQTHEEIKSFITNLYAQSPVKDEGNFYNTGFTTYFYNDFTAHLDSLELFNELKNLIIEESKLYILNRTKELENVQANIRLTNIQEKIDTVGLTISKLWFNVNPYGGYQGRHHHAINLLGGTYYLQIPNNSGQIGFSNPNPFAYYKNQTSIYEHLTLSEFDFLPQEGTLLLWPGWADHEISANNNKTENRMTISFGINWKDHAQDI